MSHYDYKLSRDYGGISFTALIMAAMRRADSDNEARLRTAFPEIWDELQARYTAPGGYLPGERPAVEDGGE